MKEFMDQDFLLETPTAQKLYHGYAEKQPIIDYHCHVDPKEIFENRRFENIYQTWLEGDHYKWRVRPSPRPSATPCTTGATWSCGPTSATRAC